MLTPAGLSSSIRQEIRRFAALICHGSPVAARSGRQGPSRRPAGRFAKLRKVRHRSCQTDLARPRRCADSGRSVAADSPGNPPIRRVVCLPRAARGYSPGRGDTGRAAVGRAGSFNSGKN